MTFDRAQLTAYALGELKGDAAREVEELLRHDDGARRFVDEVRALGAFAERDLRSEPLPAGRGSAGVFAEIARRQAERVPERRLWLQAAVIGGVIALFTLAIPLRKHFAGNVAGVVRVENNSAVEDDGIRHAPEKPDVDGASRDLAELEGRERAIVTDGFCRVPLPVTTAADHKNGTTTAYLLAGGLRVEISFRAETHPFSHHEALEPVAGISGLMRQSGGPQAVRYYATPQRPTGTSYCELEVLTATPAPEGGEAAFAAALESLARSLAEGIVAAQ